MIIKLMIIKLMIITNDTSPKSPRLFCGTWSSLVTLNLNSNDISQPESQGGSLSRFLLQCSSLVTLNLAGNGIGAEGARGLASVLHHCPSLTLLNLRSNRIDDQGARSLAGFLPQWHALKTLDLDSIFIGHEGTRSLAQVLRQCTSLAKLKLGCNPFLSPFHYDMPLVETLRMIQAGISDTLVVDGIDLFDFGAGAGADADPIERYLSSKEAAETERESLEVSMRVSDSVHVRGPGRKIWQVGLISKLLESGASLQSLLPLKTRTP